MSEPLIPNPAVVLKSVVSRPRNSNPSPTLETYLRDQSDRVPQQLASLSTLPGESLYQIQGYHGAPRNDNRTSMMVSGSDHTRSSSYQDFPALTLASTRSPSESIPSSVGARGTQPRHILEVGPEHVLSIPPLQAQSILECPFNFLNCLMTFSSLYDWFMHSLEHFGHAGPSTSNCCCFCDQTFNFLDGRRSWWERMQHIALHHRLGHRLASARPSFQLYDYLWRNKLISNADYKDLKGKSQDRARAAAAYPSPPASPNQGSVPYTQTNTNRSRHRR